LNQKQPNLQFKEPIRNYEPFQLTGSVSRHGLLSIVHGLR